MLSRVSSMPHWWGMYAWYGIVWHVCMSGMYACIIACILCYGMYASTYVCMYVCIYGMGCMHIWSYGMVCMHLSMYGMVCVYVCMYSCRVFLFFCFGTESAQLLGFAFSFLLTFLNTFPSIFFLKKNHRFRSLTLLLPPAPDLAGLQANVPFFFFSSIARNLGFHFFFFSFFCKCGATFFWSDSQSFVFWSRPSVKVSAGIFYFISWAEKIRSDTSERQAFLIRSDHQGRPNALFSPPFKASSD